jgi:aldose sugar dehydrogenase
MVSIEVMIICYLIALFICMNIVSMGSGYAQNSINNTTTNSSQNVPSNNQPKINLMLNPNFTSFNETTDLPSYWNDPIKSCRTTFSCTIKFTDGWNDHVSFSLSTTNNSKNTWSSIRGQEIDVKAGQKYQLASHMKLNKWATQSHVALEGYNETSKRWYQLMRCPSGTNGPLEWREFACHRIIPENTTKIRPVLNAGWSSQPKEEARTWFDSFYIINFEAFSVDPNLKVEVVYEGLDRPTSMAFLAPDDILVLEQNNASIKRIIHGDLQRIPLQVEVVHDGPEQGMLGIVISKNEKTYVFLYYTESYGEGVHNRLYRYEFVNNTLKNPKIILDLPSGHMHNGGQMLIGRDKYIYLTIGEASIFGNKSDHRYGVLNYAGESGNEPDGRGGILRTNLDGQATYTEGVIGYKEPLNHYYAYGIRNSFGLDFDPITGKLWDTENGPDFGDEINLVEPGFNSGWKKVQGIWKVLPKYNRGPVDDHPNDLVDFDGKGKYSSPEFTWNDTVGLTELKFLSTDKLGQQYENDMFVADVHGRIYHFELNHNRTGLLLQGPLIDKVANSDEQLDNVIFAEGFSGAVTDLEIGPDGFLYIVALDEGKIYRIVPAHPNPDILH